jgi:thiamine biosynthesis lipoprotein
MRRSRWMMGMPITVEAVGAADDTLIETVFAWFDDVDRRFSTYRDDSEIEAINRGELARSRCSQPMREVLALAELTREQTAGFFEIRTPTGGLDPSGIVKGWAIRAAAEILAGAGLHGYFVDAGGDIQPAGVNANGEPWSVGVRNPRAMGEIVKVILPGDRGVATSGSDVRGQHVYDPFAPDEPIDDPLSITVIGPDVLEADRFATAAFAMRGGGIHFIESVPGLEGYAIGRNGRATMTSGFEALCAP